MTDIAVVIVSYNNQPVVIDCLESLRETKGVQLKTYVVDNKSSNEFVQELKRRFPEITLIHNDENLGFSKANNQALRLVDTPYVLILNSDTTVPAATLATMVKYMESHKKVGMVGCRVELAINGKLDKACRRGFPTPWTGFTHYSHLENVFPKSKLFGRYNLTYLPEDRTYEVDSLVGAFMLVRKKAMDEVGLFDEDYFMYGEDIDWCYRFRGKGWKIVYHPVAKILHFKGASSGLQRHSTKMSPDALAGRMKTLDAFYNAMRIFYGKHYQNKYPAPLKWLVLSGISTKHRMAQFKLWSEYSLSKMR